jgi:hypothetical protein
MSLSEISHGEPGTCDVHDKELLLDLDTMKYHCPNCVWDAYMERCVKKLMGGFTGILSITLDDVEIAKLAGKVVDGRFGGEK